MNTNETIAELATCSREYLLKMLTRAYESAAETQDDDATAFFNVLLIEHVELRECGRTSEL